MPGMAGTVRRTSAGRPSAGEVDAVLRASRAIVGIVAASIAEVEDVVTVTQLRVLVMIHTRGPMNLAAVASVAGVNSSNASRTCDRLLNLGLLDRRESAQDRRNVTLTLTDAGRQLVDKMTRHRRAAIRQVLRRLDAPTRQRLAAALDEFATAAGEPMDDSLTLVWQSSR